MNRKQRRASKQSGRKTGQPVSPAASDPITLHALGVEAFRTGRSGEAVDLITQAIEANGRMPDFHYNLAIVLKAQGKLEEAAASYERAILLKPDYADAHNNLGNIWKALGKCDAAKASFERALLLKSGNPDTLYNLGVLCSEGGNPDEAARHLRRCLDSDPDDSRGARILLARLGHGTAPEQTSPAHLLSLYDVRSRFWDQEISYFGHALVADAFKECGVRTNPDVLDIGCGTGLVGGLVRANAGRLDGVDISPAMLEKARDKAIYDRLDQAELVTFMSGHAESYDAILAGAALIHFGDLDTVFRAAARCLRDEGLFVFTLFSGGAEGTDFSVTANHRLAQSGCFSHSAGYVERLARESGFSVQVLKMVVHEHDQDGNPIPGILAVLRRTPDGNLPLKPIG